MRDEAGFTRWAQAHQRSLLRSAYLLSGDAGQAEDLVQEALLKVALRWSRLAGENPLAYARQIIYRDQVSWWRRRRTGERPMASVPERATQPANQERRLLLLDALARLAPRQRQVLVMRYFDDLTEKDCAFVLGISVGTVKRAAHDALAALRTKAPELADVLSEV
ncbi:MAG: SigE family RNA polymerase sigma factor [Micropruina sp.]|nr:MAG: SigE family RNA polymerase sigma factor [Micropruina sp.]